MISRRDRISCGKGTGSTSSLTGQFYCETVFTNTVCISSVEPYGRTSLLPYLRLIYREFLSN